MNHPLCHKSKSTEKYKNDLCGGPYLIWRLLWWSISYLTTFVVVHILFDDFYGGPYLIWRLLWWSISYLTIFAVVHILIDDFMVAHILFDDFCGGPSLIWRFLWWSISYLTIFMVVHILFDDFCGGPYLIWRILWWSISYSTILRRIQRFSVGHGWVAGGSRVGRKAGLLWHAATQKRKLKKNKNSCRHHHPSHLTPREFHDAVRGIIPSLWPLIYL